MVKVLRNYLPAISERRHQWLRNIQPEQGTNVYLFIFDVDGILERNKS